MALTGRVESTPELEDRPALAAGDGTDEAFGDVADEGVTDGEKVGVLVGVGVEEVVLVKQDVSLLAPTVTIPLQAL